MFFVRRRVVLVGSTVLLLAACGAPSQPSAADLQATVAAQVQATIAAQVAAAPPTAISVPTATTAPSPTATIQSTATAAPTNTAAPTRTPIPPTETPTPVPPTETPTPVQPTTLSGSGNTATNPLTLPSTLVRIRGTNNGSRNFIVYAYGPDQKEDLVLNGIGPYKGQGLLLAKENTEYIFDVKAEGAWELVIEPLGNEPDAAQGVSGSGDYVSGLFVPERTGAVPFTFTQTNGERNFIAYLHCAGGTDLVVNEIGNVDGSTVARVNEGPCVWEVQADGDWTIAPRK